MQPESNLGVFHKSNLLQLSVAGNFDELEGCPHTAQNVDGCRVAAGGCRLAAEGCKMAIECL